MRHLVYMLIDWFSILIFAIPAVWALNRFLWKKKTVQILWSLILVVYLAKMYDVVGIAAVPYWGWYPTLKLIPFSAYASDAFSFQTIANAVMFLPLGFLLPMLWESKRTLSRTVLTGALLSAGIEILQMFSGRTTDIDDLIMNTLGAALGYLAFAALNRLFWKKQYNCTASSRDNTEFWLTNLAVILTIVFLRSFVTDWIYNFYF